MTLSPAQALTIALGLVLIGIAAARSGADLQRSRAAPVAAERPTFADGYVVRDGRITGERRPGAPAPEIQPVPRLPL